MNKLSKKQIKKIRGFYQHFPKTNLAYVDFWFYISRHKNLSESFIREFSDKLYWPYISKCQKLSEEFIYEFYDKVDWMVLCENKKYNFKNIPRHVKLYIALNYRELLEHF